MPSIIDNDLMKNKNKNDQYLLKNNIIQNQT